MGATKGNVDEEGFSSAREGRGKGKDVVEKAAAWSWPIRDYRESGEPGHKHARHLAASR